MASDGVIAAANGRLEARVWRGGSRPQPNLRSAAHHGVLWPRPNSCPELDCVRAFLPPHIISAAERRAQSVGLGADRVLICADAITEEAYLEALATWLGAGYERFDRCDRADCPLDDDQLIQAAAAGLLPLTEGGRIVWIVAPRRLTARRLADPHQPLPRWLASFRLTSSRQLWHFVSRYAHNALGRQAADGLRRERSLLSNAPRRRLNVSPVATGLTILTLTVLALVPAATVQTFGTLLCGIFLAAAGLRLSSALYSPRLREKSVRVADDKLPTYTIICALYHEANVVGRLAAAIRALDYPGIMAQAPQAI